MVMVMILFVMLNYVMGSTEIKLCVTQVINNLLGFINFVAIITKLITIIFY